MVWIFKIGNNKVWEEDIVFVVVFLLGVIGWVCDLMEMFNSLFMVFLLLLGVFFFVVMLVGFIDLIVGGGGLFIILVLMVVGMFFVNVLVINKL